MLGPREYFRDFDPREIDENFDFCSGCVTNWYQSMVTTLGLLALMNELHRRSVWNTLKKSNPLS